MQNAFVAILCLFQSEDLALTEGWKGPSRGPLSQEWTMDVGYLELQIVYIRIFKVVYLVFITLIKHNVNNFIIHSIDVPAFFKNSKPAPAVFPFIP